MDITLRPVPAFAGPRRTLVLLVLLLVAVIAAAALYVGAQPHLPPPFGLARNGAIVFADKAGNIYVQDSVESPQRKVMDGANGGWPSFSPDGTRFVSLQQAGDTGWDLVVADADGSHQHPITDPSMAEGPWWWGWTPDSQNVAVVSANRDDAEVLFYAARASGSPRKVETGYSVDALAFRPGHPDQMLFRGLKDGRVGLYLADLDGTILRTLIKPFATDDPFNNEADLRNPAWSPDGEHIAYQRRDAAGDLTMYTMASDGTNVHSIGFTDGDAVDDNPTWSPDGTRIAFQRLDGDGRWTNAVVDLATGRITTLLPEMPANGESLAWTPDGTGILAIPWLGAPAKILDPNGGPATYLPWGAGGAPSTGVGAGAGGGMQRLAP
jgi:Tol biopolymer transport system component